MTVRNERIIRYIDRHPGRATRQLAEHFGIEGDHDFRSFVDSLLALQAQGEIIRIPEEGWNRPLRTPYRVGCLQVDRRGDVGFVRPAGDEEEDIFVRRSALLHAFPGDLVLVRIERRARRGYLREGAVVDVVQRRSQPVRGHYRRAARGGFVEPARGTRDLEIFIAPRDAGGAGDGDKVLVELLGGPSHEGHPRGRVVAHTRDDGTIRSDLKWICLEHGLPLEYPAEGLAAASKLEAPPEHAAWPDRVDLRGSTVFTIDPIDARDFDDAISLERLPGGAMRLGVHIADVSHYVSAESPLDAIAAERGTSVYLPGTVLPMLPERLANDACSLRPDEDRLAKTVRLTFSRGGKIQRTEIFRSVIRSRRRFTYEEALAILEFEVDGEMSPNLPPDHASFREILCDMSRLRDILHRRRHGRGALYLDIPRVVLELDEQGETVGLAREQRDAAHSLIEEFMLEANEAVARFFQQKGLPLVARHHPPPDQEKFEDFRLLLRHLGYRLGGRGGSKELQSFIARLEDDPLAPVIQLGLLRTMGHAEYMLGAGLHFALATTSYCHFTSPIRRYPDLLVHQVLDEHLKAGKRGLSARRRKEWEERIQPEAERSSARERRAEEAERDMQRLRLIRYLQPRVGEKAEATVVSVHSFGFFVRLDEELIEGLVHVSTMRDDFYEFDSVQLALVGRRKRRRIAVGDRVLVELAEVDPDLREISFRLLKKAKDPSRG